MRHAPRPSARFLLTASILLLAATGQRAAAEDWKGLWTDPNDPTLPVEFKIGGEYAGQIEGGEKLGCQVIVLGKGAFQAVVYPGGLPGEGWDGANKILMDGKLDGEAAAFTPAAAGKNYLDKTPEKFSATRAFPPAGQKDFNASVCCGVMTGKTNDGKPFSLKKTLRTSPTEGKKPPAGAVVLFDGSNTGQFNGGRLDEATGLLNTEGHDILSKAKFNNYLMHMEFMLPFRPDARGQGRGNSGFYQVDHYEVQILDSFGLEGLDNECGGVYKKANTLVNMCFPPLTWQTYDVEFTNAIRDENGNKTENAVVTVRLNGVVVQDNLAITGPTGGHRNEPEGTPGPIKLQGHGNPLQFRNIWFVEKE
jgi:hypothetical protein